MIPQDDSLSLVGSLERIAIQATKEHLGISSLNHTRSNQGTSGATSLQILCHVALEENLGTKWSAPFRHKYLIGTDDDKVIEVCFRSWMLSLKFLIK